MKSNSFEELNNAFRYFATLIWENGEVNDYCGCLDPDSATEYGKNSKILYDKYEFTHFSRLWKEKGKIVLLKFGTAEGFGADTPNSNFKDFNIDLN